MTEPGRIEFAAPVAHDEGVSDREADVDGTRWALVEYGAGCGRVDWCETPHAGIVLGGTLEYGFEDGRDALVLTAGDAFALPQTPRHRGHNPGSEPARLFIIDAVP